MWHFDAIFQYKVGQGSKYCESISRYNPRRQTKFPTVPLYEQPGLLWSDNVTTLKSPPLATPRSTAVIAQYPAEDRGHTVMW